MVACVFAAALAGKILVGVTIQIVVSQSAGINLLSDEEEISRNTEGITSYYHAAVVEFYQETNFSMTAEDSITKTTAEYIEIIENIRKNYTQPLNLIVFPESTLTDKNYSLSEISTQIPHPKAVILCNSTDENHADFLKNLSCAAMKFGTVVVLNLVEKEDCNSANCSEKIVYFNTNVALGIDGTVLARYRKYNLFGEIGVSKPTTLDLAVFNIKNTTFGMMICFDIQFASPGLNLVQDKGVKNVIYPLRWISELPYLTALQTQQMWAQENDIVLLAAGANMAYNGAGGTGIFLGTKGPLQSDIFTRTATKVIYQKIPIKLERDDIVKNVTTATENRLEDIDLLAKDMDGFFILVDPSMKDHKSVVLNVSAAELSTVNSQVCHGELPNIICCNFDVSISLKSQNATYENGKTYTYQMVAFNGIRTYSGLYYGGIEACGLVACLNESVTSCGQRFSNYSEVAWPITFRHVNISANFSGSGPRVQFPTSLLSSIRPIGPQFTSWTKKSGEDSTIFRTHALTSPQNRLLTFGIFGRDFSRDWDPIRNTTSSSKNVRMATKTLWYIITSSLLILGCLLL